MANYKVGKLLNAIVTFVIFSENNKRKLFRQRIGWKGSYIAKGDKESPRQGQIYDRAVAGYNAGGSPSEEFTPISQNFANQYQGAANRNMADYGDIMGGYADWRTNFANPLYSQISSRQPTQFSAQQIETPRTSGESYAGYKNFADTGGYSSDDVRDIRARGISPIRSAYGNTMRQLNRSQSLSGGSPNYVAAVSRAQRELPQQLSDATQNVNAQLAESIRQGKLAGLGGMTGITEGEAGRNLAAAQSNQQADLRAQELMEQGLSAQEARQISAAELSLRGIQGASDTYGTRPGLAGTFGDQVLQAYQQRMQGQLGFLNAQNQAINPQSAKSKPWWQTGLDIAGDLIFQVIYGLVAKSSPPKHLW